MINFIIMTESDHDNNGQDLRQILHGKGLRMTGQRRAIREVFESAPAGLTITQAVAGLRDKGVGQATVYRAVKALTEAGLLRRLDGESGEVRYVASKPGHHHLLTCRSCGLAVEFSDCDLSLLEKLVSVKTGFAIAGHHLELFGYCPSCRLS